MTCQHRFELNVDGEVLCLSCLAPDDEMELPHPDEASEDDLDDKPSTEVDFWATQVSFE